MTINPIRTAQARNGLTIHLTKTNYRECPVACYIVNGEGVGDEILITRPTLKNFMRNFRQGPDALLEYLGKA